jgi:hypothetical protein
VACSCATPSASSADAIAQRLAEKAQGGFESPRLLRQGLQRYSARRRRLLVRAESEHECSGEGGRRHGRGAWSHMRAL